MRFRIALRKDPLLKSHVCSRAGLPPDVCEWLDLRRIAAIYGPGPITNVWNDIGMLEPIGEWQRNSKVASEQHSGI